MWLLAVRESGHDVELLDAYSLGFSWEELGEYLARSDADVLGLGTMTPVASSAYRVAEMARDQFQAIVLGGPHPTAVGTAVLKSARPWTTWSWAKAKR